MRASQSRPYKITYSCQGIRGSSTKGEMIMHAYTAEDALTQANHYLRHSEHTIYSVGPSDDEEGKP